MKKPETPQDVIENAIEYLNKLGWTRYAFQKETKDNTPGAVCAVGALILGAVDEGVEYLDKAEYLRTVNPMIDNLYMNARTLADQEANRHPSGFYSVVEFNDNYAKDKRQIIGLFRRVLKSLNSSDSPRNG